MDEEVSPVKISKRRTLEIKPYNCVICGKRGGVGGLLQPLEKSMYFLSLLAPKLSVFTSSMFQRRKMFPFDYIDRNNRHFRRNYICIF